MSDAVSAGSESPGEGNQENAPERGGLLQPNRLIPIVIASALFMELMDSSALALAIPTIAEDLVASATDLRLALTAYAMTVAIFVPISSWMANRFGARRVFIGAMMLFMIGSVSSGLASNLAMLVGSRVLQGLGGAMMIPVGRAILVGAVDRKALVKAMVWFTLPAILAPLIGPPVAGLLIEFASWRWIFFINVPVGAISIIAILRFVPSVTSGEAREFDVTGFALCGATIVAAVFLLETRLLAGQPIWLRVAGVFVALLLGYSFTRHARRSTAPIIDLRILRHATLRLGVAGTWLQRVSMGAFVLIIPLQLQIALGFTPLAAAQVTAAGAIGSVISRFTTPPLLRQVGFRSLMVTMAMLTGVITLGPIFFASDTPVWMMAAFMVCYALMRASFFMSGNALSFADIEPGAEIGHATVLFSVAQQLSLGFGYALGGGLLAALGGADDLRAYGIAYLVIALLPLLAGLVMSRLPTHAGDELRRHASA